ncbi:MAG: phosphoglucosamine mutase, partial [Tetrasphaera sp.]|nr:phosphoglucosamine mutase [Tetrasphaera sp.]
MARLFGTDGVRGLANKDITAELALGLSVAAAHVLGEPARAAGRKPKAVVGRDPRASGEFLSAAVVAGLASAGVDVNDVGVLPTPAVAFLTADMDAHFGVMLSASHNAMPDNGIKFFAAGGHKLPDAVEDDIAERLHQEWTRPIGAEVGRVHTNRAGQARYVAHLLAAVPNRLDGLTIVIDGAHGAASAVSPEVFRLAGADVIEI